MATALRLRYQLWSMLAVVAITTTAQSVDAANTVSLGNEAISLSLHPALTYLSQDAVMALYRVYPELSLSIGNTGAVAPSGIAPGTQGFWVAPITIRQDGHLPEQNAAMEPDAALEEILQDNHDLREKTAHSNSTPMITGWAKKPAYDDARHCLTWALATIVGKDSEQHTIYHVVIFGRQLSVYFTLNATLAETAEIERILPGVISSVQFNPPYRYTDFNAMDDKTFPYTMTDVVTGHNAAASRIAVAERSAVKNMWPFVRFLFLGLIVSYTLSFAFRRKK